MEKLIKSILGKEEDENNSQIEEQLRKFALLHGSMKSLMAKQEVIDLSKENTKANVEKLLKEKSKLVESHARAKKFQRNVVSELYPLCDKAEIVPSEIRP
eukprot:TRINITY_DN4121_c0_g1_i10.p2 TRINITY_DN4121_c0_g1~~TRINITY_DN4121_c0_g1_i10.p2  ORF type:complete len:100 (-),score=43.74 TRINITY_DN4121_c0_g1_i10:296-595(-)